MCVYVEGYYLEIKKKTEYQTAKRWYNTIVHGIWI